MAPTEQRPVVEMRTLTTTARTPSRAYDTDAGYDLFADIPEAMSGWMQVAPGQSAKVPTGIAVQVPPGYYYEMRGRSSTFSKHGLITIPGLIDSGYQGELHAVLFNPHREQKRVLHEQRVVQITFHRVVPILFELVQEFTPSDRGEKGWGSSGS